MRAEILFQVRPTFGKLNDVISGFSDENFNEVPFEGSWTAGQVSQHIKLAAGNLLQLLHGNTQKPSRKSDEKIEQLASIFLDYTHKMKSPDFILPPMKTYGQKPFVQFFENLNANLEIAAAKLDLSQVCLDFELPNMGTLTRLEWIAFVLFHTRRHTHQLENIMAVIKQGQ
jgi:hypothetical protein